MKCHFKGFKRAVNISRALLLDFSETPGTVDETREVPLGLELGHGRSVGRHFYRRAEGSHFRTIVVAGNSRVARALALRWLPAFLFADQGKISEGH